MNLFLRSSTELPFVVFHLVVDSLGIRKIKTVEETERPARVMPMSIGWEREMF
jgi:hypothetical protein